MSDIAKTVTVAGVTFGIEPTGETNALVARDENGEQLGREQCASAVFGVKDMLVLINYAGLRES